MTTFNTGNPLGSTAVKVLYDNAQNLDVAVNSQGERWIDRFGVERYTLAGIEAQGARILDSLGYSGLDNVYAGGLTLTSRSELVLRQGEYYRVGPGTAVPYTLSGNWTIDSANLVGVGDAALRSELSANGGVDLVNGAARFGADIRALQFVPSQPQSSVTIANWMGTRGGGRTFTWSQTTPRSGHNGGTIISPTVPWDGSPDTVASFLAGTGETAVGAVGAWISPYGALSVDHFGAAWGNKNAASIQFAMQYAAAVKSEVTFNADYVLDKHTGIPANCKMRGVGQTKIRVPANIDLTGAPNFGGSPRAVYCAANAENIEMEGIEWYSDGETGSYVNQAPAIALLQPVGLRVRRCKFHNFGSANFYAQGLIVFGGVDPEVMSSEFYDNSGDGCAFAEGGSNGRFIDNRCLRNGDWGFALSNGVNGALVLGGAMEYNKSTGCGADECVNVKFIGVSTTGNEHGIRIAKFAGPYQGDQFDTCISACQSLADKTGWSIEDASYVSISGGGVRAAQGQGIRISNSGAGCLSGTVVTGSGAENVLFENGSDGWTVQVRSTGGTYGIRQIGDSANGHNISPNCMILGASIARISGVKFQANTLGVAPNGGALVTGILNFTSDIRSGAATSGSANPLPGSPSDYLDIEIVGLGRRKIAVWNF